MNMNFIQTTKKDSYDLIENYIYLHHIDKFLILPTYPQSISDTMASSFQSTTILSRSAPIYSYQSSGPRSISFDLPLHRDMMYEVNKNKSNFLNIDEIDIDYIDKLVKELQAIALPAYSASNKMVNPPMVSVRIGDEIYIKGVVLSGVTTRYDLPLIEINGKRKYANANISFTVAEVDPYDANSVIDLGSFRGLNTTLERRFFK